MTSLKRDETKTIQEDLAHKLGPNEKIVYGFQVVPYDYRIKDFSSPTLFVTSNKLIFCYDEIFEVYDLIAIELAILGEQPLFTFGQQLLEGNSYYSIDKLSSLARLKETDSTVRFGFNEKGQVVKEFVLRSGEQIRKGYQTWAMAQMMINMKSGNRSDPALREMLEGNFSNFNQRTILSFVSVFVVYIFLKLLSLSVLPEIVDQILDVLFGIVLVGLAVWTVLSINKNLDRFHAAYRSYAVSQ